MVKLYFILRDDVTKATTAKDAHQTGGRRLIQKPPTLLKAPSYSRKAHGGHLSVTTYMGSANADGKILPLDVGENEVLGLWDYESFLITVIVSESGGDGGTGRETRGR
ncbi:hypothetical protein L6452_18422 [Arctium lappa]|uniref:Uncharacterized protein n=1 Tax=Arctium lappa TaxID=4217 RepID=A0ACB9C652_ARCLA|nr:hypothetical protein L6452_18422 [Arctium lappa]